MNLPNWPAMIGSRDIKLGLDRVLSLLARLDNPHLKLPPTIHIAGTNGKGSTLAFLQAIFQDANYKVHKYTSPHLLRFNERIILADKIVSYSYLKKIINECKKAANQSPKIELTFFEGITVAAFLAFSRVKADVLLLETGMGGRLDATNVVKDPFLNIITPISYDHSEFLGNNIADIAGEKAGIIKENAKVVVSRQDVEALEVIERKALSYKNAPIFRFGKHFEVKIATNKFKFFIANKEISLPLPNLKGDHQIENAATAIAATYLQNKFKIDINNVRNGLRKVNWPGRIEKITSGKIYKLLPKNYELYIDCGHNAAGAKTISSWVLKDNIKFIREGKKKPNTYLICSMLKSKDIAGFFKYISGVVDFVVAAPVENETRSENPSIIAKYAIDNGIKATYSNDFEQSVKYIKAIHNNSVINKKNLLKKALLKKQNQDPARIIICGSLFLVGEFLSEN